MKHSSLIKYHLFLLFHGRSSLQHQKPGVIFAEFSLEGKILFLVFAQVLAPYTYYKIRTCMDYLCKYVSTILAVLPRLFLSSKSWAVFPTVLFSRWHLFEEASPGLHAAGKEYILINLLILESKRIFRGLNGCFLWIQVNGCGHFCHNRTEIGLPRRYLKQLISQIFVN